ncbi:hypothetical protein [Streptomyces sp. NPDC048142]|uniref:hypothetical protein n=1 Tax=Streptomyces sp. NPDC048142 TaxID=3365501 RepID=UPI003723BA1C
MKAFSQPKKGRCYDCSPLVDALIDDNDLQSAWQSATDGYADQRQWLALADRIRNRQPADALRVCLRWMEPLGKQTGASTYERPGELLLRSRTARSGAASGPGPPPVPCS